jgi:predicted RNA-binding protein YlqC (UPF0109 family)
MKELISFLVEKITGCKDFVIEENLENSRVDYLIKAPKEIVGMIIGKGGKTIKIIRNLVKVRATLEKKMVGVAVEEKV